MNSRLNKMMSRASVLTTTVVLSFMFLFAVDSYATHVVGGELSYKVVGFNLVEYTLVVRRDCALGDPEADFDNPAHLGVFDNFGNPVLNDPNFPNGVITMPFNPSDTLNEIFLSGCEAMMMNDTAICVQEITYRMIVNMRPHVSGGYTVSYQRCCRNSSLSNIVDPLNTGMTLVSQITNDALVSRNQSPIMAAFPPIYACLNVPYQIDQSATDPDGDVLRYRLNTPFTGATLADPIPPRPSDPSTYMSVVWEAGYSETDMINTDPNLMIDPITGELFVIPTHTGQFLVSFCVDEIAPDGRTLNTTCREFEVNTRPCGDPAVANIDGEFDVQCDDRMVSFSSAGSVGDSLRWDFGDGTLDTLNRTTLDHTYAANGSYTVVLTVVNIEGGCYDTDTVTIVLLDSGAEADFEVNMISCTDTILIEVKDISSYDITNLPTSIKWRVDEGATSVAVDTGLSFEFGIPGNATITICQDIELANGCILENCQDFDFNLLEIEFDAAVILCLEEEATISVNHVLGDSVRVSWLPNPNVIIHSYSRPDSNTIVVSTTTTLTTTLHFTATNRFGCSVSDSIQITTAGKRASLNFHLTQECGSLTIQTVNTSTDSVAVMWNFGDDSTSTEWQPSHTYLDTGTYTITLTGGDMPCDTTMSRSVTLPIIEINLADTFYQCFDDTISLNENGNSDWIYSWSPSDLFPISNVVNPKISVTEITTVYVTILVPNMMGDTCIHVDSIVIVPVPDFQFNLNLTGGDTTICGTDSMATLTVQTMDGVVVTWKDADGNILFTGDTFHVVLEDGLNTFIVMGVYNGVMECMKSDTANVTLNRITLSIDLMNTDTGTSMFCDTANGKLVVLVDGPPGNYTYEWSPTSGVVTGENNDSLCVIVTDDITYCVTVTNTDLNCQEDLCEAIEFGADVSVTLLTQGVICLGDTVKLAAAIDPPGAGCIISWSVSGTIIGPDDQDTLCYVPNSSHVATVSIGCTGGCTSTASVPVDVRNLSALIMATATPDPVIDDDVTVQLDAVGGDPAWTYDWDGPAIDDETIKNPTSKPGRGQWTYTVMVVDEFGCEGSSTITTQQPPPPPECAHPFVFVPNAFSPNGNGENEVLQVYGVDIDRVITFIIYNRWGQEVFQLNNVSGPNLASNTWDGRFEGDELEPEVFGYYLQVLCNSGEMSTQQGNISLLR